MLLLLVGVDLASWVTVEIGTGDDGDRRWVMVDPLLGSSRVLGEIGLKGKKIYEKALVLVC